MFTNKLIKKNFLTNGISITSFSSQRSSFTTFSLHKRGFTLIELMVAISIIAVLATIGFNTYSQSQLRARDVIRKKDLRNIAASLELYYQKNGRYPLTPPGGGGDIWQYSTDASTPWINDQSALPVPFGKNYIDVMPKDPVNNANYYYKYLSDPNNFLFCSKSGQYYVLATVLENPNDPDLYAKKPHSICGVAIANNICNSSCKLYIISRDGL